MTTQPNRHETVMEMKQFHSWCHKVFAFVFRHYKPDRNGLYFPATPQVQRELDHERYYTGAHYIIDKVLPGNRDKALCAATAELLQHLVPTEDNQGKQT